ncbi:MAG: glutamate racemase [Clostridia bacterium]|nr:glutamate racemase [Clostridia bacterium]
MDSRPIGVFDSGLGGLGVVRELKKLLPNEKIIYFGDTGRVPYGTRSPDTIKKYARQDVRFLLSHGVKTVIAACGTVSSVALDDIKDEFTLPLFGVVNDAADCSLHATKNGKIAVIGTEATISSGVFEKKLKIGGADSIGVACPLFVSLVECGFIDENDPCTMAACKKYLAPIKSFGADTPILGCTHFPIISKTISKVLPGVVTIDPSKEAARSLAATLSAGGMLSSASGSVEYYVSDEPRRFKDLAQIFLGEEVTAEKIEIEKY